MSAWVSHASPSSVDWSELESRYNAGLRPWWLESIQYGEGLKVILNSSEDSRSPGFQSHLPPVIAVFDSGVDDEHPALDQKIWRHSYVDMAGCLGDVSGCDTSSAPRGMLGSGPAVPLSLKSGGLSCDARGEVDKTRLDACKHGTHVAGIIAGDWDFGVSSICPQCLVLPIKIVAMKGGRAEISDLAILRGLSYIRNLNLLSAGRIKIVNFSFGKFKSSFEISRSIAELADSGVLMIASAGNEDSRAPMYPAALSAVLAVTSLASTGKKASYASYGSWVDLSAPGGDIEDGRLVGLYSAVPGGGGEYGQGSSIAAPIVSALAGLILSSAPDLTGPQLRRLLLGSAQIKIYDWDYANGYNIPFGPQFSMIGRRQGAPLLGRGLVSLVGALKAHKQAEQEAAQAPEAEIARCGMVKLGVNEDPGGGLDFLLLIVVLPSLIVCAYGAINSIA